jgi:SAM-dependent methyltransferase
MGKMMKADFGSQNKARREAWLEKTLARLPAGWRILDAGAGESQYKRCCRHLNYVAQDFGQYDGKGAGLGLQTGVWDNSKLDIISDITSIPEPDASFDAIMCVEVFEHIPAPILAIREFSRLLKPGGKLIITAPVCSLTHFAPYYFYNGFSRNFYETHLPAHGFAIDELEFNGNYFTYLGQELRRLRKMARDYAGARPIERWIVRGLAALLHGRIARFARRDQGSEELLCFGIHALSTKQAGEAGEPLKTGKV